MKRGKKAKTVLNEKETKTLKAMPTEEPVTLEEIAKKAFPSMGRKSTTKGNSWVRNSLRWPIKMKMVKQLGRGLYQKRATLKIARKKAKRSSGPKNGKPKANPVPSVGAAEQSEAIF